MRECPVCAYDLDATQGVHAPWCVNSIRIRYARRDSGSAILSAIRAMDRYQRAYRDMFDSALGDDHVLGPPFIEILSSLLALLSGELGGQDGGNLDREIRRIASEAGLDGGAL